MCAAIVTEEARKKANLRLLQRTCDVNITDILASATHVVLYEFSQAAWSKTDIEGSLFVVTTAKQPHHHHHALTIGTPTTASSTAYLLIILNKSSNDNFSMPITSNLHLQHQEPYLICKRTSDVDGASFFQGIWFHHAHERIVLTQTLEQIVQSLQFQSQIAQQQELHQKNNTLRASAERSPHTFPSTGFTPKPYATPNATTPLNNAPPLPSDLRQTQPTAPNYVLPTETKGGGGGGLSSQRNLTSSNVAATMDERTHLASLLSQTVIASSSSLQTQQSRNPTESPRVATTTSTTTSDAPMEELEETDASSSSPPLPKQAVALEKRALQLALLSLIQDDRFLDLLHSQYLRVIKARNKKGQEQL